MMKKLLAIVLMTSALSACVSADYADQNHYMLQATSVNKLVKSPVAGVIQVDQTIANAPYSQQFFTYQLADNSYKTDYYNVFLIAPEIIVTHNTLNNLVQTGLFKTVAGTVLQIPSDYVLKSKILKLTANYTDDKKPTADIKIEYLLLKDGKIVFDKRYAASTLLTKKSTKALITGWNQSLTAILKHLDQDLYQLLTPKKQTSTKAIQPLPATKPNKAKPKAQHSSTFLTLPGYKTHEATKTTVAKKPTVKSTAPKKAQTTSTKNGTFLQLQDKASDSGVSTTDK